MPIGKAGRILRGRRADGDEARDPHATEAYEGGWYALLVQQGGDGAVDPAVSAEGSPTGPAPTRARLAEVTTLAPVAPDHVATLPAPADGDAGEAPRRAEPSPVRIGVRRVADPARTYLDYLTSSPHRHYFRAEWWPGSPPVTPVHLWRANHLGAAWDVDAIEGFMSRAAVLADDLVASAPRSAPAGSPERRAWQTRFATAGWVREFGIGPVSKALHALLPDLVADLDPAMTAWARRAWFGLDEPGAGDEPDRWLEVTELLEDVLVLRSQALGQIARRLRRSAPRIAPVSRLGPVLAAMWDAYWTEGAAPAPASEEPVPSPRRRSTRAAGTSKSRSRSAAATAEAPVGAPRAPTPRRSAARRDGAGPDGTPPKGTAPKAAAPSAADVAAAKRPSRRSGTTVTT
jgi:hypothetical protein